MADRPRRRAGPNALVHRDPRHVRQRTVVQSVEHCRLSVAGDDIRQRADPAPCAARAVRHRARGMCLWLVDGRIAGLSLGRAVSRCSGPHRGELRRRAHRRAQPGVPAQPDGDAGGRAGTYRRRPFLGRTASRRSGRSGASMRRGRSARISIAPDCISRRVRSPISARRTWIRSCAPTGRSASARVPPPTSTRSCAPGMPRTSVPMRCTTAICRARCERSARACC